MSQYVGELKASAAWACFRPRDFGGSPPSVRLSGVQHDTVMQVDDTGTLIAVGKIEKLEPTAARLPVNLELNHPFFYTIRGNQTGALFTGIAMNPNAG